MGNRALNAETANSNQMLTDSISSHKMRSTTVNHNFFWRKHCVFIILFFLMVLIAINLGFTLWILKALEVSQVIHLYCLNIKYSLSIKSHNNALKGEGEREEILSIGKFKK